VEKKSREVNIGGVINFDMIGYVSRKPYSQSWPTGINPDELRKHLVENPYVGDFIFGFGDINSGKLLDLFTDSCKMEGVDLPIVSMHVPLSYETINEKLYDLLRCDHAPFWKEGVPAITLTTTGEFRSPYYHTSADTIDRLDFEFMSKVCKSTVATAIESTSIK
jgi:Zn-dependent M28 family amino/carboxypeptidase